MYFRVPLLFAVSANSGVHFSVLIVFAFNGGYEVLIGGSQGSGRFSIHDD